MEGKKKKRGGLLIAKPDYKKAYVTLRNPLSISPDLFPIRLINEEKKSTNNQSKSSIVEEGEAKSHWLAGKDGDRFRPEKSTAERGRGRRGGAAPAPSPAKFPWSSMRTSR